MDKISQLMWMFFLMGVLLVVVAIPLILRRVKPNKIYGVRTRKSLSSPEIWYEINEYGGWVLVIMGAATAIFALLFRVIPSISLDGYSFAMLGVIIVTSVPGFTMIMRRLSKL